MLAASIAPMFAGIAADATLTSLENVSTARLSVMLTG